MQKLQKLLRTRGLLQEAVADFVLVADAAVAAPTSELKVWQGRQGARIQLDSENCCNFRRRQQLRQLQ